MYTNLMQPLNYTFLKNVIENVTKIPFFILYHKNNKVLEDLKLDDILRYLQQSFPYISILSYNVEKNEFFVFLKNVSNLLVLYDKREEVL